jgi:WD repeat-containing protein 68
MPLHLVLASSLSLPPPVRHRISFDITFTETICLSGFVGDDCQVLLWDMAPHTAAAQAQAHATPRLSSPRPDVKKRVVTEPSMAFTGQSEITSLAWSPAIPGLPMHTGGTTAPGEWIAIAMGKSIKALKV